MCHQGSFCPAIQDFSASLSTALSQLNLSSNQISEIPEAIGQLTALSQLNLSSNQISEIPEVISQLTALSQLDLSGNQIEKIPKFLRSCQNLQKLDLRGNPLPIPPEILRSEKLYEDPGDLETILSFYFQSQDPSAAEPLYEAKFIIVGEGEAGKTSLAKKIQDPNYELQPREPSTEGIDVMPWEFTQANGQPFRINIWDFGGQEIYHATHQFFLTNRSLYALVVDDRRENPNFHYWLEIVRLLSNNSPVMIIKNEKADCQCPIDEKQLAYEFNNLKPPLSTNLAKNRGLPEIQQAIQQYITSLPHIHLPIPKTWLKIRNVLENCAQTQDYISQEKYFSLCQTNGLHDRAEMLRISQYLHDLGICLHFQKDLGLKNWVILKPSWATNAVYKVTEDEKVRSNQGCFDTTDLQNIWSASQYTEMQDELLQLMQKFRICYPLRYLPNTYIAPHLLSLEQPTYQWDETANLILRYDYEFMPKGMMTSLIIEMHKLIDRPTLSTTPIDQLVWKNGVILVKDSARAEVIEYYHKSTIHIRVSGFQKRSLLERIRHEFGKIHDSYERLEYQELIPCNCPKCLNSQRPEAYPLATLMQYLKDRRNTIECRKSYTNVNVKRMIDEVIEPIDSERKQKFNKYEDLPDPPPEPKETLTPPKKVMISYSHDSEKHKERVLGLADRLRAEGLDCQLDLYDGAPDQGWTQWMEKKIAKSDFVLIVCTAKYLQRFDGEEEPNVGLGVAWEAKIIRNLLYAGQGQNSKFIPIAFKKQDEAFIPLPLRDVSRYRVDTKNGYESLYRYLTDQPLTPKKAIGQVRKMPPGDRPPFQPS